MSTTRIIRLAPGILREKRGDEVTQVALLDHARPENIRVDFKVAFERHFAANREMLLEQAEPGVLLAAVAPGAGLCARLWLRATDTLRAATVGRHSRADFYLPGDSELSLRHLAVMVRLVEGRPRLRVVDLRSGGGLELEDGTPVGGFTADGPVFFAAARYNFFCFPTPAAPAWPDDVQAAWSSLPAREVESDPEAREARLAAERQRRLAVAAEVLPVSRVTLMGRPLGFRELSPSETEDAEGTLLIEGEDRVEQITAGPSALHRGLVIGRYSRCDNTVELGEDCLRLSRVHALVVKEGEGVWVIDTASTNGCWIGDRAVSVSRLDDGTRVEMPGLGQLTWRHR
ncbi:MAG: FHA domain-containing protein [Deltaproteobacteria bacterium]|nr:FHA domain-containing protein [Deltaproteobacteria bacterium]